MTRTDISDALSTARRYFLCPTENLISRIALCALVSQQISAISPLFVTARPSFPRRQDTVHAMSRGCLSLYVTAAVVNLDARRHSESDVPAHPRRDEESFSEESSRKLKISSWPSRRQVAVYSRSTNMRTSLFHRFCPVRSSLRSLVRSSVRRHGREKRERERDGSFNVVWQPIPTICSHAPK